MQAVFYIDIRPLTDFSDCSEPLFCCSPFALSLNFRVFFWGGVYFFWPLATHQQGPDPCQSCSKMRRTKKIHRKGERAREREREQKLIETISEGCQNGFEGPSMFHTHTLSIKSIPYYICYSIFTKDHRVSPTWYLCFSL